MFQKFLLLSASLLYTCISLAQNVDQRDYAIGPAQDTLWVIKSPSGIFTPTDRASAINKHLKTLSEDTQWDAQLLKLRQNNQNIDLVYRDLVIATVQPQDTVNTGLTDQQLAQEHWISVVQSINQYHADNDWSLWLKKLGLALVVLILVFILVKYINRLFKWTGQRIELEKGKSIRGINWNDYALLDAQKQVNIYLWVIKIAKILILSLLVYLALPVVFGLFPQSQDLANTLFKYIMDPLKRIGVGLWDFFPNLVTILVISLVARYALKGLSYLKDEIKLGHLKINGFFPDWATPTFQIARVLLIAFTFVVIFPYLPGSDSPVFQGVSVFLGFLFTFGSAGSLSNIVAGIVLTYMRLFHVGDRVRIGDTVGDVVEKNMLVTRIRTIKNELISIPNASVMNSHTINYSAEAADKGLILHSTVTIGYDVPWREVHQALIHAANKTSLILKEPKPFVLQTSLDDFYIAYQINGYTQHPHQQAAIYSELHQNIQDSCIEAGIEILSPHYRALRDGHDMAVPEDKKPKGYTPPSFRVTVQKNPEL
jgi:small-conductance mechanosensitive channel